MVAMNELYSTLDADGMAQRVNLTYVLYGSLFVVLTLAVVVLVQRRRHRLNWYEKNLLEVISTRPQYIRCRALPRLDTNENDNDAEAGAAMSPLVAVDRFRFDETKNTAWDWRRKQSRIQTLDRPALQRHSEPSTSAAAAIASQSMAPVGDLSNIFTVPKITRPANSMFQNFNYSQIDRGLYQTSMDAESNYNEELIGCCGSIKLSLFMDTNLNLLTVALKQCVDLVAKRQDGYPNPYFKVSVDTPESNLPRTEHHTKVIKNTSSPSIDEAFFFPIPNGNVGQCRLEILVFDYDQFSVDECIGYCWLTLGRLSISTNNLHSTVFWAEVLPFDDDNGQGFGELLFSLTYLSKAQRLTVNVFKARNLHSATGDILSSTAIRITLFDSNDRRLKRKRTSSRRNTRNPQFNESINFNVPKHSLCDSVLEIEAIHEYGTFGMTCKVLGKLELPIHKCRDLWRAIIREEKSQARWYSFDDPGDFR